MANTTRRILVTSGLPYANGPAHLGHMVEHIQSDIWVRFLRLMGHEVLYVCGDDAHGTPIMLHAKQQGIAPTELIAHVYEQHTADFRDFNVQYDFYHTTHSPENQELANHIYHCLVKQGDIETKTLQQAYDVKEQMFLPDRFVKGQCPKCKAENQYGDNCEVCGATYSPLDLINPLSVLSQTSPIQKDSDHLFFKLGNYQDFLKTWTEVLNPEVRNKLQEWLGEPLKDWCISRDTPYFGFEIPDLPGKYFYVWLDVPIGYIASTKAYCDKKGKSYLDYWGEHTNTEIYHFIGKDITYFHTLFWPAMLKCAKLRLPTNVFIHGFMTVNGQKMSKSRGTYITARDYLNHLPPDLFRYYLGSKMNPTLSDLDLNWDDLSQKTNSDLVGKVVNLASRSASFIHKYFQGRLSDSLAKPALFDQFTKAGDSIAQYIEALDYNRAIREIMSLADIANQYIDGEKPWTLIKDPEQLAHAHAVCSQTINLFRILMLYLKPFVPSLAERAEKFLRAELNQWEQRYNPLLNHAIEVYQPILMRLDPKQLVPLQQSSTTGVTKSMSSTLPEITIEDFNKIDLRVAKVIAAEAVPEADKLLKLQLDLGDHQRQVFAGIKKTYAPEQLLGKSVIVVANLKPRQMRFGLSEGMVLCAVDDNDSWVLTPDHEIAYGSKVR